MEQNQSQIIENLYSQAKNADWSAFYEEDSDSLFWTKTPIPSEDRLAKVSKEVTFYLSNVGAVDGLIIQPFRNNFLLHNEEAIEVARLFSNKEDGVFEIPSEKKDLLFATLSALIKKDIYQDAAEAKYPIENLNQFLTSAK
jgi:hypothetical protein